MEYTLTIIKPDAVQRGLVGKIISRFENKGLQIVNLVMIHFDRTNMEELYSVHRGKSFFDGQVKFMCSGPVVVMTLCGKDSVSMARNIAGSIDKPGTIRGDFSISIRHNLIHTSDSPEEAVRELNWFDKYYKFLAVGSYDKTMDRWIYTQEERNE